MPQSTIDPRYRGQHGYGYHQTPHLERGLYSGVVIGNLLPNNVITIRLSENNSEIEAVWAAGILSSLLGFQTSYIPPIGTQVLVYYCQEDLSYVIGSMPQASVDPGAQGRSVTDPDQSYHDAGFYEAQNSDHARVRASHKPPQDLAEGEINLDNLMGVGIELLRNMSAMKGGDLARVECHLIDDMVRIISANFRHHHAFGDVEAYNEGGRLNLIHHGTSFDHEAWGSVREIDNKAHTENDDVDLNRDIDGFNDEGRWRFSQYLGWIGGFLNFFITDPVNALGRIAQDQFRSGKFRAHVHDDGSLLVQSVADIVVEKVVRIPVPNPIHKDADPQGNRSDESPAPGAPLKTWTPSDDASPFEMAFQIREHARWLNNQYSLGRFRQKSRDFQTPAEADVPKPDINAESKDRKASNNASDDYILSYAAWRIYRDGSTQFVDAYGNAITMTKTGMQLSSTKDLLLEAAGSVNIVGGRDVNIVARKNLNLTAVKESVRIASKKSLQMLVESGNFVVDVLGNGWAKIKAGLNVNDAASISQSGELNASGVVRGQRVGAAITNGAFGEQPHMYHLFQETPEVESVDGEFQYQEDYGGEQLYETLSQQALRRGESQADGTWDLSENSTDKGAPWPGKNPQEKATDGGESLHEPSAEKSFDSQPQSMRNQPIKKRIQD